MSDQSGSPYRARVAFSDEGEESDGSRMSLSSEYTRTIYQHVARCPEVEAEPPVIYQAIIFDASTNRGRNRDAKVIYQDDRPFQFATGGHNPTIQADITQPDESAVKYDNGTLVPEQEVDPIAEWTGPVLKISCHGRAKFSPLITRNGRKRELKLIVPKTTEDLLVEHVSRTSLELKSPHLLHALERLIDYYPPFHTQLRAGDKKGFQIVEPFAVVMHHFQ